MLNSALAALIVTAPNSSIDRIVVLSDRAEVVRVATAPCTDRTAEIDFEPLPSGIDARTLRAESEGTTEVLGVRYETIRLERAARDEAARLEREKVTLRQEGAVLKHREESVHERLQRLDGLVEIYRKATREKLRSSRPDRRTWKRDLDRFKGERDQLAAQRRALDKDRREHARRLSRVNRELARQSGRAKRFIRATVSVKCRGQSAAASLAYVVSRARWRPEYDLDFRRRKDGSAEVRLTVSALIEQSTGEDWSNAELRLSTARPRLGADAPRPNAIFIDGRERERTKVLVQGSQDRSRLREGRVQPRRGPVSAQLEDGGHTVSLKLPGRVTIAADGRPHWFPIDETRTTAQAKWVALPRLKRAVFRVAEFNNPAGYPLLAGRINSFVEGAFVGRSPLAFTGTQETLEVSLGLEPGLNVEREKRTDREAVEGFLADSKHLTRAYRITISNRSAQAHKIEVREQIPVSENEDIEVRLLPDGTTAGHSRDDRRGIVKWTVDIPARGRRSVDLAFEIEFPDDWDVR